MTSHTPHEVYAVLISSWTISYKTLSPLVSDWNKQEKMKLGPVAESPFIMVINKTQDHFLNAKSTGQ